MFYFIFNCFQLSLSAQQPIPESSIYIQDSLLIPTRSGIDISAIIVRKKTNLKPLPAILFYTTYHQGPNDSNFAKASADRDYVGIVAYARGIKTDLKYYTPYENESTDIYDILDYISKQPWCNGSIGMYGGSYTGFSQWATVKKIHPALKTIVPQVAVMPGFDTPMENNVQLNLSLYWPHHSIYKMPPIKRSLPFEWYDDGVAFNRMDSMAGYTNLIFQKWINHTTYDSYWKSMVPTQEEYKNINIPILTTTGYYDDSQLGALQYFKLHTKHNPKANHYVVIGPYDHWGGQRKAAENLKDYQIDSIAHLNMMTLAYEWLDFILKGKPKPALLKDKVNYQVMGTNSWKHASSLSQINNDTLLFYLDQRKLSTQKPKTKKYEKQTVDFKDRESQNNYYTPKIIFDSLVISNGVTYISEPLQKDFEITGSFTGNLTTTINKKDMDISLALYELMPDGNYFFLTRYLGRASYTQDNSQRSLLHPNKKNTLPIKNTRFVSKKITKGSRLIILLNINKHPFEIINYGSGKPVPTETIKDAGNPLEIKWHNESFIKIPIWTD